MQKKINTRFELVRKEEEENERKIEICILLISQYLGVYICIYNIR